MNTITLGDYLIVSGLLFTIGFAGVMLRRNIIIIFMSLDAFLIGIIQVLVYAGAVMVLFLFIIMLLDLRAEERRKVNVVAFAGGAAVAFAFFIQIFCVIGKLGAGKQTFPPLPAAKTDDVRNIGLLLFGNYNLPFQIIGVLILVATIGVIVMSKRELR